jgi:GcrA cell cycle regulator
MSTAKWWSKEREEQLTHLWEVDKLSASQCATKLGDGLTRNSIIGKVHRLGLTMRGPTAGQPKKHDRPRRRAQRSPSQDRLSRTQRIRLVQAGRIPKVETNAPAEPIAALRPCSLMELTPTTCRWPYGDPGTEGFHFCGGFVFGGSYCFAHHQIAHEPEKRRPIWVPMRRAA